MGRNSGTSTSLSAEEWKKQQKSSNNSSSQSGTKTSLSADAWKKSGSPSGYNSEFNSLRRMQIISCAWAVEIPLATIIFPQLTAMKKEENRRKI